MLARSGRTVLRVREPAGEIGELIFRLLRGKGRGVWDEKLATLLFLAARLVHWRQTIRPELEKGTWVVSDRFHDSTLAYQGAGQGVLAETLKLLSSFVFPEDIAPDLTLILDIDPAESFARASARERAGRMQLALFEGAEEDVSDGKRKVRARLDRFERRGDQFHERVRKAFLDIASREPERCVVIDSSLPMGEVAEEIWRAVEERCGGGDGKRD